MADAFAPEKPAADHDTQPHSTAQLAPLPGGPGHRPGRQPGGGAVGKGAFLAMFSAVGFGCMPILAKLAYREGMNPVSLLFWRFFLAALLLAGFFRLRGQDFRLERRAWRTIVPVGVIGYAATCVMLFASYQRISVGLATVIHFIYPAAVIVFCRWFGRERLGPVHWACLALSLGGIWVLVGSGGGRLDPLGVALALISGVTYAYYAFAIGHSCLREVNTLVLTFWVALISAGSALLLGFATGTLNAPVTVGGVLSVGAMALFCTALALLALAEAVKLIGSTNASLLSTLEPLSGVVLSALIFGEALTASIVVGGSAIVLSVALLCVKDPLEAALRRTLGGPSSSPKS